MVNPIEIEVWVDVRYATDLMAQFGFEPLFQYGTDSSPKEEWGRIKFYDKGQITHIHRFFLKDLSSPKIPHLNDPYVGNQNEEIDLWRNAFLDKHRIDNQKVREHFMVIPVDSFIKSTPEENLIECLRTKWVIGK